MADEKELTALDEARTEMIKAIAEYRPVALKELSRIARVHTKQCWGIGILPMKFGKRPSWRVSPSSKRLRTRHHEDGVLV
jgi:hypothetical protein